MESPESTPGSEVHSHYWPDGLVPATPQARRLGFVMDVYVTPRIWKDVVVWTEGRGVHTDLRLYELLKSCFEGLGKALAADDSRLSFKFNHWYLRKNKPNAKKRAKIKIGGRLLLHPETEEPWLLLFDPAFDHASQLKEGEIPNDEELPESPPGPDSVDDGDNPVCPPDIPVT